MAEEIKNEILSEEELDNVAGGNMQELYDDRAKFVQMGSYVHWNRSMMRNLHASYAKVGDQIGHKITFAYDNPGSNKYFIDGEQYSREDFWKFVEDKLNKK